MQDEGVLGGGDEAAALHRFIYASPARGASDLGSDFKGGRREATEENSVMWAEGGDEDTSHCRV